MFPTLPAPVIFAHRGASAHAPENTIPAFQLAINQQATAIELDVQLSSEGIPVIFHDILLSRTTNGSGFLHQHTLAELQSLNAGVAFGSAFEDVKIPTLDEVFSILDPNIFLNIELKNLNQPFNDLPQRVASVVKRRSAENRVLFSSFNSIALAKIKKLLPDVPRGLLMHSSLRVDCCLLFPFLMTGCKSIHISFSTVTRERVFAFHKLGKRVYTYTLNHPADIQHALACGVDGIFTDDPALALRTIGS